MKYAVGMYQAASGNINLKNGWQKGWGSLTGSFSSIITLAGIAGAFIVAAGIGHYIWQRRRGQAQVGPLVWTCIVGAILAGPAFVIPIFLGLVDAGLNALFQLLSSLGA